MFKKFFLTAILGCLALSANAQIATPNLDYGFHVENAAAAGWKVANSVGLIIADANGEIAGSDNSDADGEVQSGLSAGGRDEEGNLPSVIGVLKADAFTAEVYSTLGEGVRTDYEWEENGGVAELYNYQSDRDLRVNVAYLIGENLSIGAGYRSSGYKEDFNVDVFGTTQQAFEIDTTETGMSLSLSYRLAEVFFIGLGMESVTSTGTYDYTDASFDFDLDYVDNSWTNTIMGIGFMTGDPDATRFRAEYGMISSPASEEDGDVTAGEADSVHQKTTTTFAALEAQFNSILLSYLLETEKIDESDAGDDGEESTLTKMGVGWQPMEGFTVSFYSLKKEGVNDSAKIEPDASGYQFLAGYNF